MALEQRYQDLYDDAAEGYAFACKKGTNHERRTWKKRLEWLDKMLAEQGEVYMEKKRKEA